MPGSASGSAKVEEADVAFSDGRKAFLHLRGVWMVAHMRSSSAIFTLPPSRGWL